MTPGPGYYPDPQRPGLQRWWDGTQWVGQPVASPQQPLYGTPASAAGTPSAGYQPPYGALPQYGGPQPGNPYGVSGNPYGVGGNPYGAAQPGANPVWGGPTPGGYHYAQPKKRGRRWWSVFAAIVVVVLALIGTGVFFVVRIAIDDVIAPRNVASAYLGDLRDGDYANAYSRLCAQDQASVSPTRFTRAFTALHPTAFHITNASFHEDASTKIATVDFDETASNGSSGSQTLTLVHETGDWRVCHFGAAPSTWAGGTGGGTGGTGGGGTAGTGGTGGLPASYRRTVAPPVGQSQ